MNKYLSEQLKGFEKPVKLSRIPKKAEILASEDVIICSDDFEYDDVVALIERHSWMTTKKTWVVIGQDHSQKWSQHQNIIFYDTLKSSGIVKPKNQNLQVRKMIKYYFNKIF